MDIDGTALPDLNVYYLVAQLYSLLGEHRYLTLARVAHPFQILLSDLRNFSLLQPAATDLAFWLKTKWEADVEELKDNEWTDILKSCKMVSPK